MVKSAWYDLLKKSHISLNKVGAKCSRQNLGPQEDSMPWDNEYDELSHLGMFPYIGKGTLQM